jgi:hypothetical protein
MWPYFTVPLEGHIKQVWLYISNLGRTMLFLNNIHLVLIDKKSLWEQVNQQA